MFPQNDWIFVSLFLLVCLVLFWSWRKKNKATSSPSTDVFTSDLTQKAAQNSLDPVTSRDDEIDRMIHIIMRRTKNNPLLIGQPGVGKTALVEGLAQRIASGEIPEPLKKKKVLALDVVELMSNTKYRGELEHRMKKLLQKLEALKGNAILFIDEIHILEQSKGAEGSISMSDILKPALARGDIQVIGATTWKEYERYIHPNQPLDRRFQIVLVDEPTREEALQILTRLRSVYEEYHHVRIEDSALEAAVRLSDEKIKNRYLPDKAIDLIDEAAAKVSLESTNRHAKTPLGVIHAASQTATDVVTKTEVEAVIDQWLIHSKEEAKRDARQDPSDQ